MRVKVMGREAPAAPPGARLFPGEQHLLHLVARPLASLRSPPLGVAALLFPAASRPPPHAFGAPASAAKTSVGRDPDQTMVTWLPR